MVAVLERDPPAEVVIDDGEEPGGWSIEWTVNGFIGKRVTVIEERSNRHSSGRDYRTWEMALAKALFGRS